MSDLIRDPSKVKSIPFHTNWAGRFRPVDWHSIKLRPIFRAGQSLLRQHLFDPWLNVLLWQRGLNINHPGYRDITDDECCNSILRLMSFDTACAEINQNAGSVLSVAPSQTIGGTTYSAITAGDAIVQNSSNLWGVGSTGTAILSGSTGVGISLSSSPGIGQPISVWKSGSIILGATLTIGGTYVISPTGNGNISLIADLITGNFPTILGMASTAGILVSPPGGCFALGIAKA